MTDDFPKMLYRSGDQHEVFEEKIGVDTLVVNDELGLANAIEEGWHEDVASIAKLAYQEGGDPPTPEGGYPVDHDFNKGRAAQVGRADRLDLTIAPKDKEAFEAKEKAKQAVSTGNPPRHEDPSVPGPAAETEGADALKKNPGERTRQAEQEFVKEARKAERGEGTAPRAPYSDEKVPGAPRTDDDEDRREKRERTEKMGEATSRGPGRPSSR